MILRSAAAPSTMGKRKSNILFATKKEKKKGEKWENSLFRKLREAYEHFEVDDRPERSFNSNTMTPQITLTKHKRAFNI